MSNVVDMGLKLEIFPDDEMISVLEQNMGNSRFIWNQILSRYNELYAMFSDHGFPLNPNMRNLNAILKMLKVEYPFLREGESTNQQQVCRDLINAFNKFFKEHKGYPRFKSKNKSVPSFRIQKNGNNIRVSNKRIRLAKLGFVYYRTSKKYRKLLKTSKINNVTVKRKNGKYYAIVNIKTEVEELEKTGETIGIDLGLKKLATLSNTTEIDTLDLKKEEEMIKKIPKTISTKRIHEQQLQKNTQKTPQMDKPKKQQTTKRIPPIKQKSSKKIRHNLNGKPQHKRNVSKQKMVIQITKNKPIQTPTNDKIQSPMVREKIHTNKPIFPIQPTMQQLRIPKKEPKTRTPRMDMLRMWNKTPPRHQRCKKYIN